MSALGTDGPGVVVTALGLVSPLGDVAADLHEALCRGESGLAPVEGVETGGVAVPFAGQVREFNPADSLGRGNFRPLDRTGRLATVASALALSAAGEGRPLPEDPRQPIPPREREIGLVLGTMFGSVRTIAEFDRRALTAGPNYVKPLDFANSVINAAAGRVAIWHDLRGVNATIAGGTVAGLQAIGQAADLVADGVAEALLAGGADELSFEAIVGFARCGLLAGSNGHGPSKGKAPRPVPFDAGRNGFAPAEGAALLMLERAETAARRGATVLGRVLGHGAAFDPSRGADPEVGSRAVERAVTAALAAAGVAPDAIDCLSASGRGSVPLDAREATGVARALGERAATLPVTAVKSMLGEALGASGAFQAVTLIETFRTGRLPGVAGLDTLGDDCPLPAARAEVTELSARIGLATAVDRHGGAHALVLGAV